MEHKSIQKSGKIKKKQLSITRQNWKKEIMKDSEIICSEQD